ncbi:host attachment protein [Thiohalobacter sp. IOR34]|uniref:host attachment protein n=1 Tax=Thiohalobacter sp. IOR34 TaxID=3057176 RepID=UPI0025B11675|nr:host attachment protein [Thiohalobacter sp. IOR34]WJW75320.1 host attachment protein [Thiohalobacter sp. IOR34]
MNHNCVVVADGSRARFFQLEESEFPELESSPNLKEINDLVNPEREMRYDELWSEAKSGRNRTPTGGAAHGYDDHRSQHEDEFERRFARTIAAEAERLTLQNGSRELLVVAQKRTLGFLREALDSLTRRGVQIRELAKDLSKLKPLELHEHLAREHLLPKRRLPQG